MHAPDIIRQNGRSGEAVSIAGLTPRAHDKESMERVTEMQNTYRWHNQRGACGAGRPSAFVIGR